ncbi:MAG: M23 family metallopeptidase [Tepidiformaceae bacterium]
MRTAPLLAAVSLLLPLAIALVRCSGREAGDDAQAIVHLVTPPPGAGTPTAAGPASAQATATPLVPPELVLSAGRIFQAGVALASVTGDVTGGAAHFLGRDYPLTKGTQSVYAFVAASAEDAPGAHPLTIDLVLTNGTKGMLTAEIVVAATSWTADSLIFTPEQTARFLDPKAAADEAALLAGIYAGRAKEKLWSGPWRLPVMAGLSARFGEQRSINGSEPSGHHGGTDFGANAGTPVVAANAGRVVMARQLELRGDMVVIDHGGGVFSGYAHMSAFAVAVGQEVSGGDLLGYVGSTGLSTAAHLHWEVSVNGVLVDGLRFVDGTNGF